MKMFNVDAYMGTWQEIASIPQAWARLYADGADTCAGATATYTMTDKSHIRIYNVCYNADGRATGSITGHGVTYHAVTHHAVTYHAAGYVGRLRITFNPYLPDMAIRKFGTDYIIHATDYTTYSMVGSSDKSALWILSRPGKSLTRSQYAALVLYAARLGYPADQLKLARIRV